MKTILSLYDYSGNWSKPYREAGYNVIQVDIKLGYDAVLWPSPQSKNGRFPNKFIDIATIGPVYGILAAPPCTYFSGSGAKHPRSDEQIKEGLALVDACFRLAYTLKPIFFALENPVGKLSKWIGQPLLRFNPCDYGDDGHSYNYAGLQLKGQQWLPYLYQTSLLVEKKLNISLNSVLLNLYEDGKSEIRWHSDKEPQLGDNPVIPCLNLGATRKFWFVEKGTKDKFYHEVGHGDLLVMGPNCQQKYLHAILKEKEVTQARISLTFRYVQEICPECDGFGGFHWHWCGDS